MARKIVPKRRGRVVESNAPLTITISGGMVGNDHLDTRLSVINDTGQVRRIRVLGGLSEDGLQGERMTPEQRQEHDERTYAAIFGGNKYLHTTVVPAPAPTPAPTSTEE